MPLRGLNLHLQSKPYACGSIGITYCRRQMASHTPDAVLITSIRGILQLQFTEIHSVVDFS